MSKFFQVLFAIVFLPLSMLLTGCDSGGAFSDSTSKPVAKLERIDIVASPIITRGVSELMLATGNKQPFEAVGHYSDGSYRALNDLTLADWHTSDQNIGSFSEPGVLQGSQSGQVIVTAVKDGLSSNAVNVTVTEAVVTEIQVTPALLTVAKGQAVTLTAMAIYSDGTTADVTSIARWSPFDENISPAMSAGMRLVAEEKGFTYLVTAEKQGIVSNTAQVTVTESEITSIQVTPDPVNVAKGQTEQLTATASYTDGTTSDVTSSVVWASDDLSKAAVTAAGLLSGKEQGLATVTATLKGITSNRVGVTVSAAKIISIQVTPDSVSVAKGQTEQLMAKATYSDGTTSDVSSSVIWVSDDLDTATVASSGLLYGAGEGSTTVIAEKEGVTSNTVNVSVSAAQVTSIQVTPALVEVEKGFTEQLTATATYSDSTTAT